MGPKYEILNTKTQGSFQYFAEIFLDGERFRMKVVEAVKTHIR